MTVMTSSTIAIRQCILRCLEPIASLRPSQDPWDVVGHEALTNFLAPICTAVVWSSNTRSTPDIAVWAKLSRAFWHASKAIVKVKNQSRA